MAHTPPPTRGHKATLKIHPTPFKSSYLSIPPSPFSPQSPLAPIVSSSTTRRTSSLSTCTKPTNSSTTNSTASNTTSAQTNTALTYLPPPHLPLQWLWQCHQCHRSYGLGVTRRCLDDGHHFCAGTTTIKSWRAATNPRSQKRGIGVRVKKHRACGSEFDYAGWKSWGRWRRGLAAADARNNVLKATAGEYGKTDEEDSTSGWSSAPSDDDSTSSASSSRSTSPETSPCRSPKSNTSRPPRPSTPQKKDCWNRCDYPSECRWGRQFGVHTPLDVVFPTLPVISPLPESSEITEAPTPNANATTPTTGEEILQSENVRGSTTSVKGNERSGFWGALLASATRRKSVPPGSPLASVPEEAGSDAEGQTDILTNATVQEAFDVVMRDEDGDVVMSFPEDAPIESASVNSQHLTLSTSSSCGMGAAVAASITSSAPVVTLKEIIRKKAMKRKLRRVDSERAHELTHVDGSLGTIQESHEDTSEDSHFDMPPLERVQSQEGFT